MDVLHEICYILTLNFVLVKTIIRNLLLYPSVVCVVIRIFDFIYGLQFLNFITSSNNIRCKLPVVIYHFVGFDTCQQ